MLKVCGQWTELLTKCDPRQRKNSLSCCLGEVKSCIADTDKHELQRIANLVSTYRVLRPVHFPALSGTYNDTTRVIVAG